MSNLPTNSETDAFFSNIAFSIGNEVRKEFERSGSYTKSGNKYPNLPNRSSSPYQSPATQSGKLHDSILVEYDRHSKVVKVGSNVPYMKWLEEGTKKMKQREGLKQAFENTDIISIIDDNVQRFFR
jgi:phage gpG-like protein